jgi:hypothetical protein
MSKRFYSSLFVASLLLIAHQAMAATDPFNEAYQKLQGVHKAYFQTNLGLRLTTDDGQGGSDVSNLRLEASGVMQDGENNDQALSVRLSGDGALIKAALGQSSAKLGAEAKIIPTSNALYLRLNEYPELLNDLLGVKPLMGKWVNLPLSDISDALTEGLNIKDIMPIGSDMQSSDSQTGEEAQAEALLATYWQKFVEAEVFALVASGPDALPDGRVVQAYHYSFQPDQAIEFIKTVAADTESELTPDDIEQMKQVLELITIDDFVLTIGENSVGLNGGYAIKVDQEGLQSIRYSFDLLLDRLNDPSLAVAEPTDALSLEQAMILFASQNNSLTIALSDARSKARDARTVSDVKMIMTAAEMYYNDAEEYPKSLQVGQPITYGGNTYMVEMPSDPHVAADQCYGHQYKYTRVNKNDYKLDYCLDNIMGTIAAGTHSASPSGIVSNQDAGKQGWNATAQNTKLGQDKVKEVLAAEKRLKANREAIGKSGNNLRIGLYNAFYAQNLGEAVETYFLLSGQYPTKLEVGKPLVYKNTKILNKVENYLPYLKPQLCQNNKLQYQAVKKNKKVVDFKFESCMESGSSFMGEVFYPGEKSLITKDGEQKIFSNEELSAEQLSDVRQIQTAVEMYYSDVNGYPATVKSGQKIASPADTFMAKVPVAVVYSDAETCPKNSWVYKPIGRQSNCEGVKECYKSYSLSYCLETDAGAISAGKQVASPEGIVQ